MQKYQARVLWNRVLTAAFFLGVLGSGGCDGGSPGDNGDLDGSVDAQPDAWTFDCPQSQPDDYVCVRGRVRDIVDDQPVVVPSGATIRRFIREDGDATGFTNVLELEETVQPDGRFIFPSVENTGDPNYPIDVRYDAFQLTIQGDIPGYVLPDNKYGRFHLPDHEYELNYYLIRVETAAAWDASWVEQSPRCSSSVDLQVGGAFKTIVGVCYGVMPAGPAVVPVTGLRLDTYWEPPNVQLDCCGEYLLQDRLTFDVNYDNDYVQQNASGIGVGFVQTELTDALGVLVYVSCADHWGNPVGPVFPVYGMVGPVSDDNTGPVVVVHSGL